MNPEVEEHTSECSECNAQGFDEECAVQEEAAEASEAAVQEEAAEASEAAVQEEAAEAPASVEAAEEPAEDAAPEKVAEAAARSNVPIWLLIVILGVLGVGLIAILVLVSALGLASGMRDAAPSGDEAAETQEWPAFVLKASMIDRIPSSKEVIGFSLSGGQIPKLDDVRGKARLLEALNDVREHVGLLAAREAGSESRMLAATKDGQQGAGRSFSVEELYANGGSHIPDDVGFIMLDMTTGKGFAYNADALVFGASTYKAPYALFLCQQLIDGRITDLVPELSGMVKSFPDEAVLAQIERTIVQSSNDDFISLRNTYDSYGYQDWIEDLGYEKNLGLNPVSDFPWYTPRDSVGMWFEIGTYLSTDSKTAAQLKEYLENCETSFFRDALEDRGAHVISKAGWNTGWGVYSYYGNYYEDAYDSVSEAGIVSLGGHDYLVSIMTSMEDSEETQELFVTLVSALFDNRFALNCK